MKLAVIVRRYAFIIRFLIEAKLYNTMARRLNKFLRLWRRSPWLAFAYLRRMATSHAKRILPVDDWNINWLGEEMRPFNSSAEVR